MYTMYWGSGPGLCPKPPSPPTMLLRGVLLTVPRLPDPSLPVRSQPRASPIYRGTNLRARKWGRTLPVVPNPSVTPAAMSAKRLTGEQATGGTISIVAA